MKFFDPGFDMPSFMLGVFFCVCMVGVGILVDDLYTRYANDQMTEIRLHGLEPTD